MSGSLQKEIMELKDIKDEAGKISSKNLKMI